MFSFRIINNNKNHHHREAEREREKSKAIFVLYVPIVSNLPVLLLRSIQVWLVEFNQTVEIEIIHFQAKIIFAFLSVIIFHCTKFAFISYDEQ